MRPVLSGVLLHTATLLQDMVKLCDHALGESAGINSKTPEKFPADLKVCNTMLFFVHHYPKSEYGSISSSLLPSSTDISAGLHLWIVLLTVLRRWRHCTILLV